MRAFLYWAVSSLLLSGCYLFHRAPNDDSFSATDRISDAGAADASAPDASEPADANVPDASPNSRCSIRTLRKGETTSPVDMVWVVDSSRSMADESARIEAIMNQFVSDAEARHFDVRLTMVTSSNIVPPPLGNDDQRYRFVQRQVGSHEPLQALVDEFRRYRDFLRPEAALHFVVVTDDDSAMSAGEFRRQMDRLLRRPYVVHAVASPDVNGQPCRSENATEQCANAGRRAGSMCGASAIGREYYELASELGGEEISICMEDWGKVFGPLLEAVTPTTIPCSIDLDSSFQLDETQVALRTGDSAQVLALVAGPMACSTRTQAYYYGEGEAGPQVTLCPQTCAATLIDGVELDIATNCQ
jgi:hypothetical protein